MRRYSPLLLILVLVGALIGSQSAFAAATSTPAPTTALLAHASAVAIEEEAESEGEEEEFEVVEEIEFEACEATAEDLEFAEMEEAEEEEFEEEVEECEEEAKKKGKAVTAPAACVVRQAESTITTLPGSDRVELSIRYKASSSTSVAVQLRMKDTKGSLTLERTSKHVGRSGVLHLTAKLGDNEMERAEKAREFDVGLRASGTPGYCADDLEQQLRKHSSKAHGSRVYSAPARD